jgi:hypothetical protein
MMCNWNIEKLGLRPCITYIKKLYSDQLGHYQRTNKVIEELGLSKVDKNDIYGDVVYLENKGLIKGQSTLGYAYPPWMIITSSYLIKVIYTTLLVLLWLSVAISTT